MLESLEGRQLLTASLAALPDIQVPDYLGYQVPLDGSGSNATQQTYTVTSSNPDIKATVAQGPFATFNVSHTASGPNDISFSGPVTVQMFQDLTPTATQKIGNLINTNFYNGLQLFRVANLSTTSTPSYIIQGGSSNNTNSNPVDAPGTPFAAEITQQLAFTNPGQIALAHSASATAATANGSQFFFTTGALPTLDLGYTIFGQVVAGQDLVNDMSKVALQSDGSTPVNPITMSTVTTSTTNPNGVLHIDATQAQANETSTINVTATDPATNTTATQSFQVAVTPNTNTYTSFGQPFTLRPVAFSATQSYAVNTPQMIQLGSSNANSGQTLTYTITTPPANGTLSTPTSTGSVVYTPNPGFQGNDSFQFTVTNPAAKLTSDPATVSLTTTPAPTASPVSQTVQFGNPTTIQLAGNSTIPNQALSYTITTQPTKGTLSTPTSTGTVVYTPNVGASGTDTFQYQVTTINPPAPGLMSQPATVTVNLVQNPVNTGAVRQIGNVLVVTPPPGDTTNGKNTILITQMNNAADSTQDKLQVFVNGQLDAQQPLSLSIDQIVAYGSKAGDSITVDPSVDPAIGVTLDGGHGRPNRRQPNVLQAGAGPTIEHGWFGKTTLIAGTGENGLVGRAGLVKFRPSDSTDVIFAGLPHNFERPGRRVPPGGTFYKVGKHGKLVAVPTPPIQPDYQDAIPPRGSLGTSGSGTASSGTSGLSLASVPTRRVQHKARSHTNPPRKA